MAAVTVKSLVDEIRSNSPAYKNKILKKLQEESDLSNDALSKELMYKYADVRDFSDGEARKIEGKHSIDEDVDAVNPMYDKDLKGTTNNCALCSLTYDLRRRGYDVTAKMSSEGNVPELLIDEIYSGKEPPLKMTGLESWDQVEKKALKTYPDGVRGHFSIRTPFGMGHSMAFEVKDRKLIIIDPQNGSKNVKMDSDLFVLYPPSMSSFNRLDHRAINWKNVSKACAEMKPDWKNLVPKRKTKEQAIPVVPEDQRKNGRITDYQRMMIRKYKREHDTDLSDDEILKNIRGW